MAKQRRTFQRMTVAWLCVAACAETVQPVVPPKPAPILTHPATPLTADQLLQKMATTYAAASSYEDKGVISTVFTGRGAHTANLMFETAFVRNKRFRFEYREDHEFHGQVLGSQDYVIWSDFSHTYTRWSVKPGVEDDGADIGGALAAAAGVSHGATMRIPPLLLPGIGAGAVFRLEAPALQGQETVDGHSCWRVTGRTRRGDPVALWIDADLYVLRRFVTSHHFATFDTETTTQLEPQIDQPVAEAHLQPPDLAANAPVPRAPPPPMPWIGIRFEKSSTKIQAVIPGSPGEHAGLQAGDEITAINGEHVIEPSEITGTVYRAGIGARITLTVMRAGATLDVPVTLEAMKDLHDLTREKLLGTKAPVFDVPVVVGPGPARLAGLAGKVVLVDFWAVWCAPCATQVAHLNELAHQHPDLHVIGISTDAPDDIRSFANAHHVDYTLASDADGQVSAAYFASAFPTLVVIDKAGVVREVELGAGDSAKLDELIAKLLP